MASEDRCSPLRDYKDTGYSARVTSRVGEPRSRQKDSAAGKHKHGEKRKRDETNNTSSNLPLSTTSAQHKSMPMFQNKKTASSGISMKLSTSSTAQKDEEPAQKSALKFASAFGDESDSEEEMPKEAKMRMRNIGRQTPTSAGPNSFGKSSVGFSDTAKMMQRKLKEAEKQFDKK